MWAISQLASYIFFKFTVCHIHTWEGSNQQIFIFPIRSWHLPRRSLEILALWKDHSFKRSSKKLST